MVHVDLIERIFSLFPDLTQQEIGDLLDVSRDTVSLWRCRKSSPTLKQLKKIVSVSGVSWDWLIEGKGITYNYDCDADVVNTGKSKGDRFHDYACVALNALIAKTPIWHHSLHGEDKVSEMREELSYSAFEYAAHMCAEWDKRFKDERR